MRSASFLSLIAVFAPLVLAYADEQTADEVAEGKATARAIVATAPAAEAEPPGLWASFEYLNWWIRSGPLSAPLATSGNPADPIPGALGQPGTRILTGTRIDFGTRNGGRATVGAWLNRDRSTAVELSGFFLENKTGDGLSVGTALAGGSGIYVPALRVDLGRQGALSISDPLAGFGGYVATSSSSQLFGFEANLIENVARNECLSFDVLVGVKYLDLLERLNEYGVSDDLILLNTFSFTDQFRTRNQFYGAQVGAQGTYRHDWFFATVRGAVAVGVNQQTSEVTGFSQLSGTLTGNFAGGFFTQPSNIGHESKCDLSVIPQIGVKVGVQCLECLSVFAGYDCLYWYRTVRPGAQIDPRIDTPLSLGGPSVLRGRPISLFERSDFWAHGFSIGLDLRY